MKQSCRFTDEYKLVPANVPRFLPVEVARLEEKSGKFAATGCIMGGWWMKCFRRMQQMLRLQRYVRRAIADAKADPEHPAHAMATAQQMTQSLERIGKNLARGFGKHESGRDFGFDFQAAFARMKDIPAQSAAQASALEGKEGVARQATEAEVNVFEQTKAAEAMVSMLGVELTDDQRAELAAHIDASSVESKVGNVGEDQVDAVVHAMEDDIGGMLEDADPEERKQMVEDTKREPLDAVEDEVLADNEEELSAENIANEVPLDELPDDSAQAANSIISSPSALELAQAANSTVATRGAFKWLLTTGLGWALARIAWLFLYLIGTVLNVIRAGVLFPLFFAGCVLAKFMVWTTAAFQPRMTGVTGEVCPAWIWEMVGFDGSARGVGNQIFIGPARFATEMTGGTVKHVYKTKEDCSGVECGRNARCVMGKCVCRSGTYPVGGPNCGRKVTENGCKCLDHWTDDDSDRFFTTHYGCPPTLGKCKVDQGLASFKTCKDMVVPKKKQTMWGAAKNAVLGPVKEFHGAIYDMCIPSPAGAVVPRVVAE